MTRGPAPGGFTVDHNRVQLGAGQSGLQSAKTHLMNWKMFELGWLSVWPQRAPLSPGENVVVKVVHYGFWSLNACRIVYLVNETDRFGFAYGTLHDHAEIGEERFMVELKDGVVWYDILAYSRPGLLARIGRPLSRPLQKRFARDSMEVMRTATRFTTVQRF
jgi:uncharacterized protein (UPF0548 family)